MANFQTNICKGVAVLLLLWHHLFFQHPEYGVMVWKTSLWAKICVHIFLLLSGYGLYFSMRKQEAQSRYGELSSLWVFYKRRFGALMPRYWVICLIGLAVSMFVFHIMPSEVFPSSRHPWGRVAMQILGLHMIKSAGWGYNPTWWFMTTIIVLYVFYPLLHAMFSRLPMLALLTLTGLSSLELLHIPTVGVWIIPFIYGIFMAQLVEHGKSENTTGPWIKNLLGKENRGITRLVCIGLLALISLCQYTSGMMAVKSIQALAIVLLCCQIPGNSLAGKILEYLGMHSYNIFLVHTLLNYWIFFKFIYKFKSTPLWALPLVLFASLFASICVNWMISRINKFARI